MTFLLRLIEGPHEAFWHPSEKQGAASRDVV